jgi:hypothetical protein
MGEKKGRKERKIKEKRKNPPPRKRSPGALNWLVLTLISFFRKSSQKTL